MLLKKISAFRLSLYQECPKKFLFYSDYKTRKEFEKPKSYFILGDCVHTALREFFKKIKKEERTWEILKDLAKRSIGNYLQKSSLEKSLALQVGGEVFTLLKSFFENQDIKAEPFYLPPEDELLEANLSQEILLERLNLEAPFSLNFTGKVDRVDEEPDGRLHIIDYKTGKEEEEKGFQFIIYPLLVSKKFKRKISKMSYFYLLTNRWVSVTRPLSKEKLKEGLSKIIEIIIKMNQGEVFEAKPKRLCQYCDFLPICPKKEFILKEFQSFY